MVRTTSPVVRLFSPPAAQPSGPFGPLYAPVPRKIKAPLGRRCAGSAGRPRPRIRANAGLTADVYEYEPKLNRRDAVRMRIRRRLAAAVATLAVVLSIFGGLLAAPAAAQTGATPTLDPIHWEVIPGALTWTADHGFQITVSCRTTTHDPTWLTPGGRARNSILYLHLKLQKPDPAGPIRDQGRRWRDIYWTRNPGTNSLETNAQQCNLFKGVDVPTPERYSLTQYPDRERHDVDALEQIALLCIGL